jgi:hypothetical protein
MYTIITTPMNKRSKNERKMQYPCVEKKEINKIQTWRKYKSTF